MYKTMQLITGAAVFGTLGLFANDNADAQQEISSNTYQQVDASSKQKKEEEKALKELEKQQKEHQQNGNEQTPLQDQRQRSQDEDSQTESMGKRKSPLEETQKRKSK